MTIKREVWKKFQIVKSQKSQMSCMPCDDYIVVKGEKYVSDVYNSMSDGKGGFEF